MAFDNIEKPIKILNEQSIDVPSKWDFLGGNESVKLNLCEPLAFSPDCEANVLACWLIMANWYANWPERLSYVVMLKDGHFLCPDVHPDTVIFDLQKQCKILLNDIKKERRLLGHAAWEVRAFSDAPQVHGLFGLAKVSLTFQERSVVLSFRKQIVDRNLAHEILDVLFALLVKLPNKEKMTAQELVKVVGSAHATSELVGQLHGVMEQDVLQSFELHVKRSPDKFAIYDAGVSITYEQLSIKVEVLAQKLRMSGVTEGSRIALEMSRSSDFIVAALAVLSLNAIYVPLDPELPTKQSQTMIEDAGVGWIVKRDDVIVSVATKDAAKDPPFPITQSSCGYILFTSGTSGRPKGVLVSRSSLSYYASVAKYAFSLTDADRVLQFATVSFDASVEEIFPCLMAGGTLVIRDANVDLRPAKFLSFVFEHGITFLDLPTGYWRELSISCISNKLALPPKLRLIVIGGEALYKSDIHNWYEMTGPRPLLINTYGPTETTVVTAMQVVRKPDKASDGENIVSIGRPIAGSRIILLDRFDNESPFGGLGQICISSPGVADGYLCSSEMTDEKFFVRLENDHSSHRYYKSGDLGRIGLNGTLEYHGRIDNVVKRQGFRINLSEIELIIQQIPQVFDCSVVMDDADRHKKLICMVQLKSDQELTSPVLRQMLSDLVPHYMVPNSFIFVDELPRTLSGKIDQQAIRIHASSLTANINNDDEENVLMDDLVLRIEAVLGGRRLDWHKSLMDNGADSLEIVRIAMLLEEHTGCEFPLPRLYSYRSLEDILADAQINQVASPNADCFSEWRYDELEHLKNQICFTAPKVDFSTADGILITGATGLLGRYIVLDLLTRTKRPLYCLVRGSTVLDAELRLHKMLKSLGVDDDRLQQLQVIAADLALGDPGFSKDYLCGRVLDIIHAAADTNMLFPYSVLKATNVLSSVGLINLALAANARFHFVSSLALFDTALPDIAIGPDTSVTHIDGVSSGYLQSKWVVEALVEQLRTSGLQSVVFRCGRLWGPASNIGEASNDFIYQFLSYCLMLRQFPKIAMQLEVSPADRIAQKAVQIILDAKEPNSRHNTATYHLCSPKSYDENMMYATMRLKERRLVHTSPEAWLESLKAYAQKSNDKQAMKMYAVMKSLSLTGCIDNLVIKDSGFSQECSQDSQHAITPEQMIDAISMHL